MQTKNHMAGIANCLQQALKLQDLVPFNNQLLYFFNCFLEKQRSKMFLNLILNFFYKTKSRKTLRHTKMLMAEVPGYATFLWPENIQVITLLDRSVQGRSFQAPAKPLVIHVMFSSSWT